MIDDGDSWMNPMACTSWSAPPPKNGVVYAVERKKRLPVSGNVAFIEQWATWEEFDSKEKRDAELERLRNTTVWQLRGRIYHYVNGVNIRPSKFESLDE